MGGFHFVALLPEALQLKGWRRLEIAGDGLKKSVNYNIKFQKILSTYLLEKWNTSENTTFIALKFIS